MSLWTSNMTPPPWIFLSFLFYIYYMGKFPGRVLNCNRTDDFGFLDSYNMWLMKVKESQKFQFLPLMLLIFMQMNFNPLIKLLLFIP